MYSEVEGWQAEEVDDGEEDESEKDLTPIWTRDWETTVVAIGGRRMGMRAERLHPLMGFAVVPLR